MSKDTK